MSTATTTTERTEAVNDLLVVTAQLSLIFGRYLVKGGITVHEKENAHVLIMKADSLIATLQESDR